MFRARTALFIAVLSLGCGSHPSSGGGGGSASGGGSATGGGSAMGGGSSTGGGSAAGGGSATGGGAANGGGSALGGGSATGGGSASGGGAATGGGSSTGGGSATGGGSGTGGGSMDGGTVLTGNFLGGPGPYPGAISGLHYRSGNSSGFTDDAGTYQYEAGQPVIFSIGDIDFRATPGEAQATAYRLVDQGSCVETPELTNAVTLLFSLDTDNDSTNGLQLPAAAPGTTQRDFATLTASDLSAEIAALIPGRTALDGGAALDTFITAIDSEVWTQQSSTTFTGLTGGVRSQGVTTDGTNWYFSWRYGFDVTDTSYGSVRSNPTAIPLQATIEGDNHIGDIDMLGSTLWAPLEDGTAYQHPNLCEFDPQTLSCSTIHPLSNTLLTQGVPYVIADGPRGNLYVSQWDPIDALYVFDVATVTYQRSIPLRPAVGRVQGGKVFEGSIYLASDNAAKSIYKVHYETGTVIDLIDLNHGNEQEGMAFWTLPDGTQMHTLNVTSGTSGTELRHHQRTRDPLRKRVCP